MNVFDIFITYVEWKGGGKTRPILVIECQEIVVAVFNITTQYENKKPAVRAKYFKINDWEQSGLDKPSYVDTNTIRDLPVWVLNNKTPVGKLSDNDKRRLIEFLNN
jgi:hypothetical protein